MRTETVSFSCFIEKNQRGGRERFSGRDPSLHSPDGSLVQSLLKNPLPGAINAVPGEPRILRFRNSGLSAINAEHLLLTTSLTTFPLPFSQIPRAHPFPVPQFDELFTVLQTQLGWLLRNIVKPTSTPFTPLHITIPCVFFCYCCIAL